MNLFNGIFSLFSRSKPEPETKIVMMAGNGYSSGSTGGAKFPGGISSVSAPALTLDHGQLRQSARHSMFDSSVPKSIVDRFADTVVETGLRLKPIPESKMLGITPEAAEEWAEDVAQSFHLWAKSKKSHRSRINNFYQNQHLYEKFQQRDNDIFTRFYYSREKDLLNPLQLDFVDPNQIRGYSYTSSYAQTAFSDGITRDSGGREIGYKIWYLDDKFKYTEKNVPAIGAKSKRTLMIHGFNPEYAGQGRGYSRLSHALQEFQDLTSFKLSTIQKAINQASFIGSIENDQQDASNPLEGMVAGPSKEYGSFPTPAATAENVTTESLEPINWQPQPEATIRTPGSTLVANLRKGDSLKYLKDTSPSENYNTFVDSFCSYLSASMGMPLEVLLIKFNSNYSASRAALIMFWRQAQIWRDEMAADFLNPVYESWLSEEIAAGKITAPGWSDFRLRAAWLSCEWAGSPMPNIDPNATADADLKYASMGAQTLDDIARNFNGSSGKANRIKNARQFVELPEPPLPIAPIQTSQITDNNGGNNNA